MAIDYEFRALEEANNYRRAILQEFSAGLRGEVLEVGAGVGQFSRELLAFAAVTRLVCLEPDPEFARAHRANVPGATLLQGVAHDYAGQFSPDGIVSLNVLEHVEDDQSELRLYRRMLEAKGGTLCLLVPARPELYAKIDAKFGHLRRYGKSALGAQLLAAGFNDVTIHYFNSVGYFAWLLIFKLLRTTTFDPDSVRFYDRHVFPWVHRFETRLCRPPLGQSLVAVAR